MDLVKAIGDVRDMDILSAREPIKRKNTVRLLLIAAILTAILTITAAAITLWGRSARMAEMPDTPAGETRAAFIRNGVRGTPTYKGTAEWFAFMAQWEDLHGEFQVDSYDLEFTKGDFDYYQTCQLYGAYDQEQAKKLYEIAEKYGLKLYRNSIPVDELDSGESFFRLSGCNPFTESLAGERFCGYVFEDGSFKLEETFLIDGIKVDTDIHKIHSGVLYPYGGADSDDTVHREEEYVTAQGQTVMLDFPQNSLYPYPASIYYVSGDGDINVQVSIFDLDSDGTTDYVRQAKALADAIDFKALEPSGGTAHEILNYRTAAEDNPELVKRLEEIRSCPAMKAPGEFQKFYLESPELDLNDLRYDGVYDEEKYPDVSRKLRELAEASGLTYAARSARNSELLEDAVLYDNGAWRGEFSFDRFDSRAALHYIPKTALYTGWAGLAEISEYREVWEYTAADGTELLCFSSGPEYWEGAAQSGMLLEAKDGWLILESWGIPYTMGKVADMVDWKGITQKLPLNWVEPEPPSEGFREFAADLPEDEGYMLMDLTGDGKDELLVGKEIYLHAVYADTPEGIVELTRGYTSQYLCRGSILALVTEAEGRIEMQFVKYTDLQSPETLAHIGYDPAAEEKWTEWVSWNQQEPISYEKYQEIAISFVPVDYDFRPISDLTGK